MPIASAQVKSSILLATLYSEGTTKILENKSTRDHTERMLKLFGSNINHKGNLIVMNGKYELHGIGFCSWGYFFSCLFYRISFANKGIHIVVERWV